MVSLQREDQKDQHWEKKRQSERWAQSLGDAVLLQGENDPCVVSGVGHSTPWHGEPGWDARQFPSARLSKQQLGRVLAWREVCLQGRPRASFAMQ